MTKPTTSSCIICGKKFTKSVHNQQTCSSNCRKKRAHDWEKNERVRTPKQLQKKRRYMKSYHKKNKKRNNERSRKHHQKNKQKDNARSRKYQKEHREELGIKKNAYNKKHRKKIRKQRAEYREKNRDKVRKAGRDFYKKNSERINTKRQIIRFNGMIKLQKLNGIKKKFLICEKCGCCKATSFDDPNFKKLTVAHRFDDGADERRKWNKGKSRQGAGYEWVRQWLKRGCPTPKKYGVQCRNCNI